MMFWDSSAIVPLLVREPFTDDAVKFAKSDREMILWAFTPVECLSAIYRKSRDFSMDVKELSLIRDRLRQIQKASHEVLQFDLVRARAERLIAVHALRSADSMQLAAALVVTEDNPAALPFVTFDKNLALAALKEGFSIRGTD